MTELVNNRSTNVSPGVKNVDMRMSSGDARLQMSVNGSTFTDIADSVKTTNSNFNITVPECQIRAVITGDAVVNLSYIR